MAINVATDIVSDVLNSADPATARASTERLMLLQKAAASGPSAGAGATPGTRGGEFTPMAPSGRIPGGGAATVERPVTATGGAAATYRKFEAFVLQTFLDSMLPRNDQIFGKGTAGNVWRSMLAERLGAQLADAGGIGIARALAKARQGGTVEPSVDGVD